MCTDDIGTFHVKWNFGRELGVVVGKDSCTVLPPELTTLKLNTPLAAEQVEYDECSPYWPVFFRTFATNAGEIVLIQ